MNTYWCLAILAVGCVAGRGVAAPAPPLQALEQQFGELPPEARRLTGPLFWLHGDESRERLELEVAKVAEGGNGCFTAESRPHNDWLGEGWYRDLGICLDAAKRHGLQMWIFDEKWWPSGEVAGTVPEQYGSKRLAATTTDVTGPTRYTAEGFGDADFIAAVAARPADGGLDGSSLIDLAAAIREGTLTWEVPAGEWQVIKFTWTVQKSGNRYLVDGASADAVEWYLRTVYQPHYDRFPEEFGRTIQGFFYDEPETHGDWGTEVQKVLDERGVDWKRAFVAWKLQLAGEEQAVARYQYQDALAEAWGRTLYGGITRWCEAHGVKSIGHFLEHGNAYLNQDLCAGDMLPLQKYSSMGGIDAVFDQFIWGRRVTRDAPVWQTPKLGSSVTHAYGRPDDVTMVEIFGARGQDLTYPEMKWWTDHMQVSGVNFLIPHSFNPRAPYDMDCPPYFYNGGFEPRWPLYRVWADYTSRLSLMLTGGRHVCPVALLFAGGSAHVGRTVLPEQLSEALQDALFDCDWLPYEVFEGDAEVAGRDLRLRNESYRVLVVPPVEVIPYATLAKAKAFFDAGGVVIGYGFLPTRSATLGRTSADIAALCDAVWGRAEPGLKVCRTSAAGGRSYLLPEQPTPEELQQVLAGDAGVHCAVEVVEGQTDHWLHVLHRVRAGRDVFFLTNQNHTGVARRFRLRVTAEGECECWDAMRNDITAVPGVRTGDEVELTLTLQPNESVLLVFQPERRDLPVRWEPGAEPEHRVIPVRRDVVPAEPAPVPEGVSALAQALEGCAWIWFPEGDPAQSAPPGTRYFRRQVSLPTDRKVRQATFVGTADNSFALFVNGQEAGRGGPGAEDWRRPVELDLTGLLQPGTNQLALAATNASDQPNPAGAIGKVTVEFEQGEPLVIKLDATWKASDAEQTGWTGAGFDDAAWPAARVVAQYGDAPWGPIGSGPLTLSPAKADPFVGHVMLPDDLDPAHSTVYLELRDVAPEAAARVTVNGQYAGGCIGAPLRVPITAYVKPGRNAIGVEPFAPRAVRVLVCPR